MHPDAGEIESLINKSFSHHYKLVIILHPANRPSFYTYRNFHR